MKSLIAALVFASSATCILCQINCSGKPDGPYGAGCSSYTQCTNGVGVIVDCDTKLEAFSHLTGKCEPIDTVPMPCGSHGHNCANVADGKYAIMPECTYFYTCYLNEYHGTGPCNNPPESGLLVFDEEMQICNWRSNVKKPCGDL